MIIVVNSSWHFNLKPHLPFFESIASASFAPLLSYLSSTVTTVTGNDHVRNLRQLLFYAQFFLNRDILDKSQNDCQDQRPNHRI
jgi:hypothetical protein